MGQEKRPARGAAKIAARAAAIFERLAAHSPDPRTELDYINPFTLLVAVVLSAQATDAGVNKATKPLFAIADTPKKMAALGEPALIDRIKTIGLFRNKAKNVIALSQALIERHGGEVPRDREALEALPGVGRKTANVVLNVAFGEHTIAVDTHVFRVANRLGDRAGQDAARGRGRAAEGHTRALPAPRAPLADPARALHLQGAGAGMRAVRGERFVSVAGEDGVRPFGGLRVFTKHLAPAGTAATTGTRRPLGCGSAGSPERKGRV